MADHYFSRTPDSAHRYALVQAELFGRGFTFQTDAGVFSREHIDPGSALLIEAAGPLRGRVLDLGCGWGAIGIPLAYANPDCSVEMVDINERAIELCRANIDLNGVKNARAFPSDGLNAVDGGLSAVVTNPPVRAGKQAMHAMFAQAREKLAPGGALLLVIRKQQGAPSTKAFLEELFGNCNTIGRGRGYWVLKSVKESRA